MHRELYSCEDKQDPARNSARLDCLSLIVGFSFCGFSAHWSASNKQYGVEKREKRRGRRGGGCFLLGVHGGGFDSTYPSTPGP